jgi:hypothetical protein
VRVVSQIPASLGLQAFRVAQHSLQIPINVPPMANHCNVNRPGKIIYRIDHAIISDAKPPEISASLKFDYARQSRAYSQCFNFAQNPVGDVAGRFSNSLRAESANVMV